MGDDKILADSTVLCLGNDPESASLQHVPSLDSDEALGEVLEAPTHPNVSKARGITMIVTLSGISFLNTMGSGILIAALPRIAHDVGLDKNLILVSFPNHLVSLWDK